MAILDAQPDGQGVARPDPRSQEVPPDACCQEAEGMIADRYLRCGEPATAVVGWPGSGELYYMCHAHAWHSVRNRGAQLRAGTLGLARLLPTDDSEEL